MKILIIDDEPQIRRFLKISLTSQQYNVIEAANGAIGIELAAAELPDIIILDLGLPDQDGQVTLKELRFFYKNPVIVLSVRNDEAEKVMALDNGANDYVVKPFGIKELLARLRGLSRLIVDTQHASFNFDDGYLSIDLVHRKVQVADESIHLSKKEFELLSKLYNHHGRVVTQQQLLRDIWGNSHTEDSHYLRIFIAKLRSKLGDDSAEPKYIETEPGVGYRFIGTIN